MTPTTYSFDKNVAHTDTARILLRGKGCVRGPDGDIQSKLTNIQVMRACSIPPSHIELAVRRLTMVQQWIKEPLNHQYILTVLFDDQFDFEKHKYKRS